MQPNPIYALPPTKQPTLPTLPPPHRHLLTLPQPVPPPVRPEVLPCALAQHDVHLRPAPFLAEVVGPALLDSWQGLGVLPAGGQDGCEDVGAPDGAVGREEVGEGGVVDQEWGGLACGGTENTESEIEMSAVERGVSEERGD